VSVIDGAGDSARARITVGLRPRDICLSRVYHKAYVVNDLSNDVTVINCSTDVAIATVPVGMFPWATCCNQEQGKVYVANLMQGTVTVIDCATNQKLRDITVMGGPQVLLWTGYPTSLVFCVNGSVQTVSVIDGVADSVIATLPIGEYGCALAQADDAIVVANRSSSSLTVLEGLTGLCRAPASGSRWQSIAPTVCRRLPLRSGTSVYDAQGRRVRPGENPGTGIYFLHSTIGGRRSPSPTKVLILR